MKFEYKVVSGHYDSFPEVTLNELAAAGWELVTVTAATVGGRTNVFGYFKRAKK